MTEFIGTLKPPRQSAAPSNPVLGQMYADTDDNTLYWWDGTQWISGRGGSGGGGLTEVYTGTGAPSPRGTNVIWIDTDEAPTSFYPPPVVTSLPANPVDGQECYYFADQPGNGRIWHLAYNAARAAIDYGWLVIGGSPIGAEGPGAGESTSSATYANLGTVGPQITVPLEGLYELRAGAMVQPASAVGAVAIAALKLGAAATNDNERVVQATTPAAAAMIIQGARTMQRTLLAGDTVLMQYRSGTAVASTYFFRWLYAMPVRVK